MESRVNNFLKIYPSLFLRSLIGEDPQNFIDEVKKIFGLIQAIRNDKVFLLFYELKDIAYFEFTKWNEYRGTDVAPVLVIA